MGGHVGSLKARLYYVRTCVERLLPGAVSIPAWGA